MRLKVITDNCVIDVLVPERSTVASAKAAILQECAGGRGHCHPSSVWLKSEGNGLHDDLTLEQCGVRAGATLSLHVRARGGGVCMGKPTVAPSPEQQLTSPRVPLTAVDPEDQLVTAPSHPETQEGVAEAENQQDVFEQALMVDREAGPANNSVQDIHGATTDLQSSREEGDCLVEVVGKNAPDQSLLPPLPPTADHVSSNTGAKIFRVSFLREKGLRGFGSEEILF